MKGLRENGVEVIECRDDSKGFLKYWRLWKKHQAIGTYDVMIVGYPGHLVVPFAKLISRKPVIADLLGSLADAEEQSHEAGFLRRKWSVCLDHLAVRFADVILLESEAQKHYFEEQFGTSKKYRVLYTGADEAVFYCGATQSKNPFTVLFRGRLTPESGILHILEAARILIQEKDLRFRIIGSGPLLSQVKTAIEEKELTNVELIAEHLSEDTLREKMCDASLSLGQFENNPRLSRTIPHKAFESFAMGIPYLSGDAPAIREIVSDGETGFLVPLADPFALADKIHVLQDDPVTLVRVGTAANVAYREQFSPRALATDLLRLLLSYK